MPLLDRWKRRVYHRDLAGAANFLGLLKVGYLFAVIGTGVWLLGVFGAPRGWARVYGICLLVIFTHGFLATTSRPVLWATVAAAAQTIYVVRVLATGGEPWFGSVWMLLLWGGVRAAREVERILAAFPELRAKARRMPWRTFWFVALTFGIAFLFMFLISWWWIR